MHKIGKIFGCCLIAVTLLACTACSGLDRLSENLKDGATQLSDDVVIGKSNALITPYQSFEGSRTSDNDTFQARLPLIGKNAAAQSGIASRKTIPNTMWVRGEEWKSAYLVVVLQIEKR